MMSIFFPAGEAAYVVRKEVTARRGQGTMYATFYFFLSFLLLKFLELIDSIDENAEAALVAAARKELAYLKQFDRPLLPFQRERREAYG